MRIKICGITNPAEVGILNRALPSLAGFVFAASRWRVLAEEYKRLRRALSPEIKAVGVFKGNTAEEILFVADALDMVQVHGDEAFIKKIKPFIRVPLIKGVTVRGADIAGEANTVADYILFDGGGGGEGKKFDWEPLKNIDRPFILAGGVTPENAERAASYKPYALDVLTGARTNGELDEQKVKRLVNIIG